MNMSVAENVMSVLQGWFTKMAIQHCGKDYGSEARNQYFFYRKVYNMSADEAWGRVKQSRPLLGH